jgi:radical SAM protein with 4Fe4S-binding SPASM domain
MTLKCNLHCTHCHYAPGRSRGAELTLDECFSVVDELVALGCGELTLIGGEILLFHGWQRVARRAADGGIRVNLRTNGYRLGPNEIRQIRAAGVSSVGVSIDGLESVHNRIRGRGDCFARVRQTLAQLRQAAVPVSAVTSLMALNYPELDALYTFLLIQHVDIWRIQLVNPAGNMAGRMDELLPPARVPELIEFIAARNREHRMLVLAADNIGYYHLGTETEIRGRRQPICYWEGCQAGLTSLFIDSAGNVRGCGALHDETFIEANLTARPLREIWRDERLFAYNRAFDPRRLRGACRRCDMGDLCRGGCRASNYLIAGDLFESAYCARVPHATFSTTMVSRLPNTRKAASS